MASTIAVSCPKCENQIKVPPELAGKSIRCKECLHVFKVKAPAGVKANSPFSLTITVVDSYGNIVTGYRGKISFHSSDSTAALPKNYTFTAADAGVHTFTGLKLRKKGQQTITVTDKLDGSLTASVSIGVI